MKLCLKEAIKRIALLEKQKSEILLEEDQNCTITYGGDEDRPYTNYYSFDDTRKAIKEVDADIRSMRHKLHHANATVQVQELGMTIGECIIYMAQLNIEKATLEHMARKEPKTRRTVYGGAVEWTETNYGREECRESLRVVTEDIVKLQMAIDRANLTHEIEV